MNVLDRLERVEITGIGSGGAGVGRLPDGRAVFVHRTAPDDVARVRVTLSKPRWARAELVQLEHASPQRRPAPCPFYDRCGGCTLEHLTYQAQLAVKSAIVAEALARIGGLAVTAPQVAPSPCEFRYRNRVSFTLLRFGRRVIAGFHEIHRPARVIDIDGRCRLPEPALAQAWDALRSGWGDAAARLPAGERLRLTLRATLGGDASLLIDGGDNDGAPDELLENVPQLRAIWGRPHAGARTRLLAGDTELDEDWDGETIRLGAAAFTQVNRAAAERLERFVIERALAEQTSQVVDAYCGIGLHARRLAARGVRVTGIEVDPEALSEARRGAPSATFLEGRVEDLLPRTLPADLVILNPPRAGLHARVPGFLIERPPRRLLYVSCDPATLARDVQRLAPTFAVRAVACFDLFPQTAHVESVAELVCATS
ncbi:MAG: class I SAM-dependent RNA methyltransferase [Longimicrobiales bacterium]